MRFVPTSGIDGIPDKNALQYGLKHGLFTQEQVNSAQKKYEATHPKK